MISKYRMVDGIARLAHAHIIIIWKAKDASVTISLCARTDRPFIMMPQPITSQRASTRKRDKYRERKKRESSVICLFYYFTILYCTVLNIYEPPIPHKI